MKEKGRRWVAKATVIVCLMVLFVRLVMGEASSWSALRAAMFFAVLLGGYRWGLPGGAVAGLTVGLTELVWGQSVEGLGLLCAMGIVAGCFWRLGKSGTTLAFVCTGVWLGLLYAEGYLETAVLEMLVAGGMFLMMPVDAMMPVKEKMEKVCGREELQRQKLEEVAHSYGKLARSMELFPLEQEDAATGYGEELSSVVYEEDWKSRFLESREAVSMQFREMERALKEMAAQLDEAVDVTAKVERQVRSRLRQGRMQLQQLLVLEKEGQRQEAYVTVRSHGSGCVTAREVGETVGKILSRNLRPADGGRTVVGKEACTIRLVEETKFRLLTGLARTAKDQEDLSGDTFSCHELPDGRRMLCLSDGMGSGRQAFLESQLVTEWLEELLDAGFAPERAIHMVNGLLVVQKEPSLTTLDLLLLDLYTGQAMFYKQGAVGTFIRRGHQVLQVEPGALPMGVDCEADPCCDHRLLQDGDMIVMVTDGVLDALEGENKEEALCRYLAASEKNNAAELADDILAWACSFGGQVRDDMTVLTAGVWRK